MITFEEYIKDMKSSKIK